MILLHFRCTFSEHVAHFNLKNLNKFSSTSFKHKSILVLKYTVFAKLSI